jgi:RHS repeat-associated protein
VKKLLVVAVLMTGIGIAYGTSLDPDTNVAQAGIDQPTGVFGGPTTAGSPAAPTALGSLQATHRYVDVSLKGAFGIFPFTRHFTSTTKAWKSSQPPGAPFGLAAGVDGGTSLYWWHNLYSWAYEDKPNNQVTIRNPDGALESFNERICYDCFFDGDLERYSHRLYRTTFGHYVLFRPDGRYYYQTRYQVPNTNKTFFFLSSIEAPYGAGPTGLRSKIMTLDYTPRTLPTGGGDCSTGAPQVRAASTQDGIELRFYYSSYAGSCRLTELRLARVGDPETSGAVVASYGYDQADGELTRAELPFRTLAYAHNKKTCGEFPCNEWIAYAGGKSETRVTVSGGQLTVDGGYLLAKKTFGLFNTVEVDESLSGVFSISAPITQQPDGTISCYPGKIGGACPDSQPQRFSISGSSGDGTSSSASLSSVYTALYDSDIPGTITTSVQDQCSGSCAGASPGVATYGIGVYSSLTAYYKYPSYQKQKNGNYDVNAWRNNTSTGIWRNFDMPELASVFYGASSYSATSTPTDSLSSKNFSYSYPTIPGLPDARLQRADSVRQPSVTSGQEVETRYNYDPNTNRLVSVIRCGRWDASANRCVGTFYRSTYASGCTSQITGVGSEVSPDPWGRTLERQGPCFVDSATSTSCSTSISPNPIPIRQYAYYAVRPDANSQRLWKEVRWKRGSAGNCPTTSDVLVTEFLAYDTRGHATALKDPNGIITARTYNHDRLTAETIDGTVTTEYDYDDATGNLKHIKFPQGNYEVFCYRKNATGPGCAGGTPSPYLQFKAKASDAVGAVWSEKVTYTYWADGNIKEELFWIPGSSGDELRRVVKHQADPHRRPSWSGAGDPGGPSRFDLSSYSATKKFDGNDNLVSLGFPYNQSAAFCPDPAKCVSFAYDRMDRLTSNRATPASGQADIYSCIDYDRSGQPASIMSSCAVTSCSSRDVRCGSANNSYTYNDFGLVYVFHGPDGESVNYYYDAAGNVVQRSTGDNAGDVAYSYDLLGRVVTAYRRYKCGLFTCLGGALYNVSYDSDGSLPPTGCVQPENTNGRARSRFDSGGTTWFSYDKLGRLVREIRPQASACNIVETSSANLDTAYTYSTNGNLASIKYPRGRKVLFTYGSGANADRVAGITVRMFSGEGLYSDVNVASGIVWEPYGGLRAYQMQFAATRGAVEYLLGDNASSVPSPACNNPAPSASGSDHSGRIRGVWVSQLADGQNYVPGQATGDIFRRTYTWTANQVTTMDTCIRAYEGALGIAGFQRESYTYDRLLRLTTADAQRDPARPTGPGYFETGGGAYRKRTYTYDDRGNQTASDVDEFSNGLRFNLDQTQFKLDRVLNATGWGPYRDRNYQYTSHGRTTNIDWAADSAGTPGYGIVFNYADNITSSQNGADESVFKSVTLSRGGVYNYYYDALGRRRKKVYPTNVQDEFFYDGASQLLLDIGAASLTSGAPYPSDEYIWLAGRPIMMIRSSFDANWQRRNEAGTCSRLGDSSACGRYYVVTDVIGKPILMLDSSRRVVGAGEYTPYGELNRVEHWGHYINYPNYVPETEIASFRQEPRGMKLDVRMGFDTLDTERCGTAYYDPVRIRENLTSAKTLLYGPIGGYHQGNTWTGWIPGVEAYSGRLQVTFQSDSVNWGPDSSGCASNSSVAWTYRGVALRKYEFRRYETGATPIWTPLRFPGQYYDAETDLHENWRRYYDPTLGRYLQPDPALADPAWVLSHTRAGRITPAYAYAADNPITSLDRTGMAIIVDGWNANETGMFGGIASRLERNLELDGGYWLQLYFGRRYAAEVARGRLEAHLAIAEGPLAHIGRVLRDADAAAVAAEATLPPDAIALWRNPKFWRLIMELYKSLNGDPIQKEPWNPPDAKTPPPPVPEGSRPPPPIPEDVLRLLREGPRGIMPLFLIPPCLLDPTMCGPTPGEMAGLPSGAGRGG